MKQSSDLEPVDFDFASREQADLYDELPLWSAPFGLLLLDHVEMRPGLRILDVGAGTGFLTIELAQRCRGSRVVAVDPWSTAMERLRRKVDFIGLDNVSVRTAAVEAAELEPASFDVAVSNLGINNFADPEASLRACFEALEPGGRLWLTSNVCGHMRELYAAYRDVLREIGLEDRIAGLDEQEAHRGTIESVSRLLEQSGYRVVERVERETTMRFADGSSMMRHYFIRLGFLGGWSQLLPDGRRAEALTALAERLDEVAEREGGLKMTIPMVLIAAERPRSEPPATNA